jgi:hypothetical protein
MVNYFDAHKLLDETRDGHNHSESDITAALELTGDIDPEVCRVGVSWWGSSPEGRKTGLPVAEICRTGSGVSGIAINDPGTD